MALAIKALRCNGFCRNCYEKDLQDLYPLDYDINKIARVLKREIKNLPEGCNPPTIHGGEPLLFKEADLEKLLKIVHGKFNHSGIQTNGVLINARHIKLFKKYKTQVGISIDGHTAYLNQGRWNRGHFTLKAIQEKTDLVLNNMMLLKKAKVDISVIIVLRKYHFEKMDDFIKFIYQLKVIYKMKHLRINPVIEFGKTKKEELTNNELWAISLELINISLNDPGFHINEVRDVVDLLMGDGEATCTFGECDPYCTAAETPIFENGQLGNCLKSGSSRDGLKGVRVSQASNFRSQILKQISQFNKGCKDCEYWELCYGGCPGAGINDDWRNRTRFCEYQKRMFDYISHKIKGLFPNIYLATDKVNRAGVLDSISKGTWQGKYRKNLKKLQTQPVTKISNSGQKINHGDGYGDDSRPWTLKNPHGNMARAVGYKDSRPHRVNEDEEPKVQK